MGENAENPRRMAVQKRCFWSNVKGVLLVDSATSNPANSTSDTIFLSTEKRDWRTIFATGRAGVHVHLVALHSVNLVIASGYRSRLVVQLLIKLDQALPGRNYKSIPGVK